jgi:hypothetical protein
MKSQDRDAPMYAMGADESGEQNPFISSQTNSSKAGSGRGGKKKKSQKDVR